MFVGVIALGACSTPPYTRADAARDLREQTKLSDSQIDCVLDAVEVFYADEYRAKQASNGVEEVSEQQTEVYVKNAIAAAADPTAKETAMFDDAVSSCT